MKIENIEPLVFSLIRKESKNIELSFESLIVNEKSEGLKARFRRMYDEYKRWQGRSVLEKLDADVLKLVNAPYKDCSFSDLFLPDNVKKGTECILREWKFKKKLVENGLRPVNRVLLEGPPGNGKTSYAIALAKELGLPLLNTSSSMMLNSYLGQSEKNVSVLFQRLPEECVLFIDEFEAMASSRAGSPDSGSGKAWNSIVTSFLVNMEYVKPSVMFIAATNRSEMVDPAVMRRFDLRMRFLNPTPNEKEFYIEQYLKRYQLSVKDFLFDQIVLQNAVSYSDLEKVMQAKHKEIVMERLVEG